MTKCSKSIAYLLCGGCHPVRQFGETPETLTSLKEVQKVRERLRNPYSRLNTLLLRIAEYQPIAPAATLNLLGQSISSGQAISDAALASVNEVKRYWNL